MLYREAVVWKRLEHQNIVPFLGITLTPLQLISEWMPGGPLAEYIKKNPNADRLGLVGVFPAVFIFYAYPVASYLMSPTASAISTPAT